MFLMHLQTRRLWRWHQKTADVLTDLGDLEKTELNQLCFWGRSWVWCSNKFTKSFSPVPCTIARLSSQFERRSQFVWSHVLEWDQVLQPVNLIDPCLEQMHSNLFCFYTHSVMDPRICIIMDPGKDVCKSKPPSLASSAFNNIFPSGIFPIRNYLPRAYRTAAWGSSTWPISEFKHLICGHHHGSGELDELCSTLPHVTVQVHSHFRRPLLSPLLLCSIVCSAKFFGAFWCVWVWRFRCVADSRELKEMWGGEIREWGKASGG